MCSVFLCGIFTNTLWAKNKLCHSHGQAAEALPWRPAAALGLMGVRDSASFVVGSPFLLDFEFLRRFFLYAIALKMGSALFFEALFVQEDEDLAGDV